MEKFDFFAPFAYIIQVNYDISQFLGQGKSPDTKKQKKPACCGRGLPCKSKDFSKLDTQGSVPHNYRRLLFGQVPGGFGRFPCYRQGRKGKETDRCGLRRAAENIYKTQQDHLDAQNCTVCYAQLPVYNIFYSIIV